MTYPVPRQPINLPGPQIVSPTFATIPMGIGAYTWAGIAMTVGAGLVIINMGIGAYTWAGKTVSIATSIAMKMGVYTWSGNSMSIRVNIGMNVGTYTWSGKIMTNTPPGGTSVIYYNIGMFRTGPLGF